MTVIQAAGSAKRTTRPRYFRALRSILRLPVFAIFMLSVVALFAAFAPQVSRGSPTAGSLRDSLLPPFWLEGGTIHHPLGTDFQGRDILTRIIYGARISLVVALVSIAFSATLGTLLGLVSGYYGRTADFMIMRVADLFFSIPTILVAMVFAQQLGPSLRNVILIVLLTLWARYSRQVRAEVLSVRQRDFVSAARIAGASGRRILLRHILPNVFNTVIVLATFFVGQVILLESTLSFLGVGIPPPAPTWGVMIADGRRFITEAWWMSVFPGVFMALTILALNQLGDWVRDRLDPNLRQL